MIKTNEENEKKLQAVIEDVRTCMFTTTNTICDISSRPMYTVRIDNEHNLWFFSCDDSQKEEDIRAEKNVTLVYSHPGKNSYLNVYGTCTVIHDKEKMKNLWLPTLKAWFPEGVDQPSLCLLKVSINEAFCWDNSTSEMAPLFKKITHKLFQGSQNKDVFYPQESTW